MVYGSTSPLQHQVAGLTVSGSVIGVPIAPNRGSRKFSEHLAPHLLRENRRPDWGLPGVDQGRVCRV